MDSHEPDILGGPLPISPSGSSFLSSLGLAGNISLAVGLVTLVLLAWKYLLPALHRFQERRYRKASRRKHGIPDSDHRPFNVAYAAATRARQQLEAQEKAQRKQESDDQEAPPRSAHTPHPIQPIGLPLGRLQHIAGSHNVPFTDLMGSAALTGGAAMDNEDYARVLPRADFDLPVRLDTTAMVDGARHQPRVIFPTMHSRPALATDDAELFMGNSEFSRPHAKRALDEDQQARPETSSKKSRMVDEEGDEEELFELHEAEEMDVDEKVQPTRGSKRAAEADDEDDIEALRSVARDKRARKVSRDKAPEILDLTMGDEGDEMDAGEVTEQESSYRGKKRDRAEADSSFGGDESFIDDLDERLRRSRKRRTVTRKDSETRLRGQKRGRDLDSLGSDDEELEQRISDRRKRGKRGSIAPGTSLDEDGRSQDPLCKGRYIGDQWEVNGIHYKVGPNGQRLRQELVKRSRSRFPMPKDSQHPDRKANIDVYVETWLSEEEYKVAKEQHELAWQDSPSANDPATPGDVSDIPGNLGKSLLWGSSTPQVPDSPLPQRGPFRQSVATNVGFRINPFQQSQFGPARRVSSIYHATLSPAPESPKLRSSKSFSKWEKQDLEAAAMMKIREKAQREALEAQQAKTIASAPPAALPSNSGVATPTLTLGKPADTPVQPDNRKPVARLGAPPTSATSASTQSLDAPKVSNSTASTNVASAAAPNPFSLPSSAVTPASTNQSKPTSAAPSSNPFLQPSASQESSSSSSNTLKVPSFGFTPPTPSALPSGTSPALNIFGAAGSTPSATPAQPSTQPKASFTFGATSTPGAPSATPVFGGLSSEPKKTEPSKVKENAPAVAPSLMSRLGLNPAGIGAAQSSATPGATSLSFGQPSAHMATPASSENKPASAASASSSGSTAPKFSFGITKPPASTPPQPTIATPADPHKSAVSTFGFAAPSTKPDASSTSTTAAPSPFAAPASQNKFSFGTTTSGSSGTSNPFGAPSTPNAFSSAAMPAPAEPSAAPKSSFTFGAPGGTSNAFGAPTSSPAGVPIFGGGSGTSTATSSDASKPQSAFGSSTFGNSSTPVFGATTGGAFVPSNPSTSTPAFGVPASSAPSTTAPDTAAAASTNGQAQSKPSFSFNFGANPSTAPSPFAPANNAAPSPFGAPSTSSQTGPSAFGFNNPSSSSTTSGAFSFGSSNTQNQK